MISTNKVWILRRGYDEPPNEIMAIWFTCPSSRYFMMLGFDINAAQKLKKEGWFSDQSICYELSKFEGNKIFSNVD